MPAPFEIDNEHVAMIGRIAVKKRKAHTYIDDGYEIVGVVPADGTWAIVMESLVDGSNLILQECSFNLLYRLS